MTTETIASDGPGPPLSGRSRTPDDRSRLRATALTAAVSLVLVGGVATAAYRNLTGGTGPEQLIPASAFAVAAADLSLPGGQSDAIRAFADHFPDSPTNHSSGSTRDVLLRALFAKTSDPHIDYSAIKPWLGDHVAIAGWFDQSGKPQMEVLVQSTDDAAARTTLEKTFTGGDAHDGLTFSDGYAVIAKNQTLADEAVAAAKQSSLGDTGDYADDVNALPGSEDLTGWIDGPGAKKALSSALSFSSGLFGASTLFALPGVSDAFKSRVAVGLHFAAGYAQIDERVASAPAAKSDGSQLLTHLPDTTIAALELGDPGALVKGLTTGLTAAFGAFGAVTEGSGSAAGVPVPALSPPVSTQPYTHVFVPPAPINPLAAIEKATGLKLPDDLLTLFGSGAVVSYGGLQVGGLPNVAIRSQPTDLAAAQAVVSKLQAAIGKAAKFSLSTATDNGDLVLATNPAYADAIRAGGNLGGATMFGDAMGNLPDKVSEAAYVDLTKILPLLGSRVPVDVQHLRAVGLWGTTSGDVATGQLRLVVG